MTVTIALVRRNAYVDSVSLLQVTADVAALDGVLEAALVMATDLNREVLSDSALLVDDAVSAGPNDLVIAVRAIDETAAAAALQASEALLARRRGGGPGNGQSAEQAPPRSLRSAHRGVPEANLAVISVPGPFAAGEARLALADGLNVFLFSDNVSVEDEVSLKQTARDQGLLVMGPDCGTAILNGIGLGFSNAVRRGRIGLIGASGTGLQEVTSLLHQAGEGVSQAIGTGGRDLSTEVGGITTLQALALLRDDPQTETIVLISKPPAAEVADSVLRAAAETGKPVVACLLGSTMAAPDGVRVARNLYQAARLAAPAAAAWTSVSADDLPRVRLRDGQRQVRGLFCGGTLCDEAEAALAEGSDHRFIDFGDDQYTRGRAHPMIDPTLRNHAIVDAGADPRVAVLLLDVILGRGSHADPAGAAAPAIREAIATASADGRQITVLAHVVGTDRDPQGLAHQEATLREVGVHVLSSNYHAAVAASLLLEAVTA
ncbi:MAG TPA: acyl-CoA synthetase FdrA [Chloroflexota bacterium]|nr:acyl-CoA synthetase FdrA [Chloroflexota bacterium]